MNIAEAVVECGQTEEEKGWREDPQQTFGEFIALCHSELSEALEEHRNGHDETEVRAAEKGIDVDPERPHKPEGIPIELADVVIRIFARCEMQGIDIETALKMKMEYNRSRAHRHGGKVL